MNEIVTVLDIETTGLDPFSDHITEIAAIRAEVGTDGNIREIGRFQTFVELPEDANIPDFVGKLSGISASDLIGAPTQTRAALALEVFATGTTIIAHNAPFDLSFLFIHPETFVCTRALSRLVDPERSARLADCCERYGIDLTGHHRAMNDVEATLHLYAKLREKAEVNGISYHNVVVDSAERPLIYVPHGAVVRRIEREKTEEAV